MLDGFAALHAILHNHLAALAPPIELLLLWHLPSVGYLRLRCTGEGRLKLFLVSFANRLFLDCW